MLKSKVKFNSMLEIPSIFASLSGSEESLSSTPTTPRRFEYDDSQDVKSSSGSSATLRRALRRTFSWGKKKHQLSNQEKLRDTETCKIFVLGYSGIGKTAAVVRFLTGRYIHEYQSTREESYTRSINVDGRHTNVQITSITEQIHAYDERIMENNTGIILAYSIVDMMSFHYICDLLDSIGQHFVGPIVLVGMKADLGDKRCIRKSAALKLADENKCPYFEISAASDFGIKECFTCLLKKILCKEMNKTDSAAQDKIKSNRNTRRSSVS